MLNLKERRFDCYRKICTLIDKERERLYKRSMEIPWAKTDDFQPLRATQTDCIESSLLCLKREIVEVLRETFPIDDQ